MIHWISVTLIFVLLFMFCSCGAGTQSDGSLSPETETNLTEKLELKDQFLVRTVHQD